jgi:hypothetical protein
MVSEAVKRLIGAYRKGEAEDAETYTRSIAIVLAAYPQEVVYRVTDPRNGIQSRSQWLPTVHEVKEACEREMLPIRNRSEQRARIERQFAERDRIAAIDAERGRVGAAFKTLAKETAARVTAEALKELSPEEFAKAQERIEDMKDARGVSDPVERAAIVAHHEQRLSALRSRFENEPVGDCTGLVGRAGG